MTGALARWPGLSRSAALMAGLAGLFALGVALDPRLFAGESVWLKPLKFALSVGLHLATIALLLAPLPAPGRGVRAALAVVLVAGWFELLWIGARAGAGQPSHFAPDALGAVMFGLMGLGATLLTVIPAALGAAVLARGEGPWRVPAGLGLLVGGALGFVSGAAIGAAGGPLLGDATLRLPLLGWSLSGGDLRLAHFVGLHAMQALPLAAAAIGRARWRDPALVALAVAWVALTAWLMARALAGLPPA